MSFDNLWSPWDPEPISDTDALDLDEAYYDGYCAHVYEFMEDPECPYPDDREFAAVWLEGFMDAVADVGWKIKEEDGI